MKLRTVSLGLLLVWLLANPVSRVRAQQDETIYDKDIKVVRWEKMNYPGGLANIESVVVVRVKLDREGNVVDAVAISGDEIFKFNCLDNAKKWQFAPNRQNAAILVYNFRIIKGPAYCPPEVQFVFYPPNYISITGCGFSVQTQRDDPPGRQ